VRSVCLWLTHFEEIGNTVKQKSTGIPWFSEEGIELHRDNIADRSFTTWCT